MRDRPWVARALVEGWDHATDEDKADPLRYGPWTREATVDAFRSLDLPVPTDLQEAEAECVMERQRTQGMRIVREVWHIVLGDGDADFQPILCGQQDGGGINLLGPSQWREPTCPSCIKARCNNRRNDAK
jgi:hypothetical protein